ncbi:MAG TPA: hypothetical protein VFB38_10095 [Chthonomonadaceae bacterium]|nr:hypothetical protein [Chthonomonadaceae bacterium]
MSERLPVSGLPAFAPDEEASVIAAFAPLPALAFEQRWRQTPEAGLKPGHVKVGRCENALWALAEMEDEDIFNLADAHNQPTWELGDVFEVFAQPQGEPGYIEVHVTPENYRLYLRFPDETAIRRVRAGEQRHADYVQDPEALVSYTWVHRQENFWRALLKLPLLVSPGAVWRLSFCRYDATHGAQPVAASTSPYTVADFHRPSEWWLFLVG